MKNFKSFGFWTALAGAFTVLMSALGKCFGFSVDNQVITDVIMAIAGLLVVLGVVSMPKSTQDQTQSDDEKTEEETQEASEEDKENK